MTAEPKLAVLAALIIDTVDPAALIERDNPHADMADILRMAFEIRDGDAAWNQRNNASALLDEIEVLKRTLRYYADDQIYDGGDVPCHIYVLDDHGRTARQALSQSPSQGDAS